MNGIWGESRQRDIDDGVGVSRALPLPDADIDLMPAWLDAERADAMLAAVWHQIPWERHRLRMFGREIDAPRLSCWIGDPGAVYVYSRSRFEPRPWPPVLTAVRDRLSEQLGVAFNSVLANLYRDGRDSMGWHSDDEPELGPEPTIASLSLGATRTFALRHREQPGPRLRVALTHGSLLVMRGGSQRLYRHALPRAPQVASPRLNLTFRRVGTVPGR